MPAASGSAAVGRVTSIPLVPGIGHIMPREAGSGAERMDGRPELGDRAALVDDPAARRSAQRPRDIELHGGARGAHQAGVARRLAMYRAGDAPSALRNMVTKLLALS
ncbi:uncharacterized protein SOCEGT47_011240 [Sorangium cellulosum]|uniref:Uncharacterized protein n=1 Tax=Sorangium cellulosum TaxID=56 RepID=A0A4P2PVR3_SORCE|nr:uncharacterized protein SOCEGT47_011240 [Sorangium cellulosum]